MLDLKKARKKAGFAKIEGCCHLAMNHGIDWAWVDTCCIDKTSSAELSETINSMFKWYEKAKRCYAYLSDVSWAFFDDEMNEVRLMGMDPEYKALFKSRWWTRGWTLQELIAPHDVGFYTQAWEHITNKADGFCKTAIAAHTGIPSAILDRSASLASEDIAYCLLGIFDVHMPLLYGEGLKAFVRLQLEILSTIEDYTILLSNLWMPFEFTDMTFRFDWPRVATPVVSALLPSILAPHPRSFVQPPMCSVWNGSPTAKPRLMSRCGEPPQMTSRGLKVCMLVKPVDSEEVARNSCLSDSRPELGKVGSLDDFFEIVDKTSKSGFGVYARGQVNSVTNRLYLGTFQRSGLDLANRNEALPCFLLLALIPEPAKTPVNNPTRGGQYVGWYSRVSWFHTKISLRELHADPKWKFTECYLNTRTDSGWDSTRQEPRLVSQRHDGPVRDLGAWRS